MLTSLRHPAVVGVGILALSAACLGGENERRGYPGSGAASPAPQPIPKSAPLPAGTYEVQDVRYDDGTGNYQVLLLGTPPGRKPLFQHTDIQLARIADEEVKNGKRAYFEAKADGTQVLYLPADFKVTYVHNVTQEVPNPSTGRPETVIVRQETSSWSPFLSAMAGAAVGNMLFSPRYYYPPPYSPGGLTGYGGVGSTPSAASQAYADRFGTPPKAATVQKTGLAPRKVRPESLKSSGRGAGSSRWKKSSDRSQGRSRSSGGFGRGRRRR